MVRTSSLSSCEIGEDKKKCSSPLKPTGIEIQKIGLNDVNSKTEDI